MLQHQIKAVHEIAHQEDKQKQDQGDLERRPPFNTRSPTILDRDGAIPENILFLVFIFYFTCLLSTCVASCCCQQSSLYKHIPDGPVVLVMAVLWLAWIKKIWHIWHGTFLVTSWNACILCVLLTGVKRRHLMLLGSHLASCERAIKASGNGVIDFFLFLQSF